MSVSKTEPELELLLELEFLTGLYLLSQEEQVERGLLLGLVGPDYLVVGDRWLGGRLFSGGLRQYLFGDLDYPIFPKVQQRQLPKRKLSMPEQYS